MFIINDTENNPVDILDFKGVKVGSNYLPDTGECTIQEINSDHTEQDIVDNYDAWKAEWKTAEENKVDLKASAKQKLMAGEPMTEEEANLTLHL